MRRASVHGRQHKAICCWLRLGGAHEVKTLRARALQHQAKVCVWIWALRKDWREGVLVDERVRSLHHRAAP